MKEIKRDNYPSIIKKTILQETIEDYKNINLKLIEKFLNETISEHVYNTIDLITLLRINYEGNLKDAIKNIPSYKDVRFNCYYATNILKEKLNQIKIKAYIITYKSIGFSTSFGDNLIKEAHMALIIPTLKNNKLYYLLLDPGLRIPGILGFYANDDKTIIEIDNDKIIIERTGDKDYPYSMEMIGYNRYSTNDTIYQCKEYFNTLETINPTDVLFPASFEVLDGYRIINFKVEKNKWAFIKLMIIDEYLECRDASNYVKLSFEELRNIHEEDLIKLIKPFANKLDINITEFILNVYFILNHYEEFIHTIINSQVLEEKCHKKREK